VPPQGELGYTGSQGPAGTSVQIVGTVPTSVDLPDPYSGDVGDGYIVQSTGFLWIWEGEEWFEAGQITGYTGSQGVIGFTGSEGYTGSLGYTGSTGFVGSTGGFDSQQEIVISTSTTYTLSNSDIGKLIALDNLDQIDVIIPNDSVLNFGIGQRFDLVQYNQGPVLVAGASGVSIYSPFEPSLNEIYSVASVVKIDANQWVFVGPQAAGYTGSQGVDGYTGSQGIGFTGSQGDIGFTGSIGGFNSVQTIKSVTAETYSLVDTDAGKILFLANSSEDLITVTVPTNSSMPWSTGQRVDLRQVGIAPVQVQGAVGVDILSNGAPLLFEQDSVATLIKTATDSWVYVGPQSGYTGSQGYTGSVGYTGSIGPLATRDMYTFGGNRTPEAGTAKVPYLRVAANTTCVNASLTARTPPAGGSFVVEIQRSSNSGVTFPDTVATVTLTADSIVAVASTTVNLSQGDLLRLNIVSVNGAQDWACQLLTQTA